MLCFVAGVQATLELISPVLRKKPGRDSVFPPLPCLIYTCVWAASSVIGMICLMTLPSPGMVKPRPGSESGGCGLLHPAEHPEVCVCSLAKYVHPY